MIRVTPLAPGDRDTITESDGPFARLARNSLWLFGGTLSARLLGLVRNLILARLLTPGDFGLFGFATTIISTVSVINPSGFGLSVLYEKSGNDLRYRTTAFWLNALFATGFLALVVVAVTLMRNVVQRPDAIPIFATLAAATWLQIMSTVHRNIMRRELRLKTLASIDILAGGVGFISAVALAFAGSGVWALVWSVTFTAAFTFLLLLAKCGWVPSSQLSVAAMKEITVLSGWYLAASLVSYLALGVDRVLIGRFLGFEQLGYYVFAYDLSLVLASLTAAPLREAAVPELVYLRHSSVRFWRAYLELSRLAAVMVAPLIIVSVAGAPIFIPWLFGESWRPAITPFQIIIIFTLGRSVIGDPFVSLGRFDLAFRACVLLLGFSLSGIAASLRFGIDGVAAAVTIAGLLAYVLAIRIAGSADLVSAMVRAAGVYLLAGFAVLVFILLSRTWMHNVLPSSSSDKVSGILIAVGVASYAFMFRHSLAEVASLLSLPRRTRGAEVGS